MVDFKKHLRGPQQPRKEGIYCKEGRPTGIRDGNGGRVDITKPAAQGRANGHGEGASGADDDRPEEGRLLAGCPATVLEGRGPEHWRGHGFCCGIKRQKVDFIGRERSCAWREFVKVAIEVQI